MRSSVILASSFVLWAVVGAGTPRRGLPEEAPRPGQDVEQADPAAITNLLGRYCIRCHGPRRQKGKVRFDTLDFSGKEPAARAILEKALRNVKSENMPPEDAKTPSPEERTRLVASLEAHLGRLAAEARRTGLWTRNRRLTVEEYAFTMQALFGVDAEMGDLLPADPVATSGYRNESELLGLSSLQIEAYLDSARRAVGRYVQFGALRGAPVRYHVELEDLYYSTAKRYETRRRAPGPIDAGTFSAWREANRAASPKYVDALGPTLPGAYSDDEAKRAAIPKLHQQYVAIPRRLPVGELIVRVRAAGTPDRNGRFPRMRVEAGITLGDGCSMDKRVLGEADVAAPLDAPRTYAFRMRLEDVPTKGPLRDEDAFDRLSVFDMDQVFISNVSGDDRAIFALGRGAYADPATGSRQIAGSLEKLKQEGAALLHLDALEIEMLPGIGAENRAYRWRVPAEADDETAAARAVLAPFMRGAYRRAIAPEELAAKMELFEKLRGRASVFEESLRETLAAVLVSPSFLFLESRSPDRDAGEKGLAAHRLAARLSYFLWLSPPDKELRKHAEEGTLGLRREAERLLDDPRRRRFLESFCRQWLRLDKHANVAVSREDHPTYDGDLAALSLRETMATFVEVFESGASALDLIDADYAIVNDRLADHYGIGGVTSGELRKVGLPEGAVRGGLLTQASLLTLNSDGVDSHPIRRGVWLLDRFLHDPPPPPPPNVPEIDEDDPDFRGLSLKERIELHRQPGRCRNCHAKIDPWGIPFENLDAVGRWREAVRSHPVDAASVLPGGRKIGGIVELKRFLRKERAEQFGKAFVHHLLTFAMGRPPDYADRRRVEMIEKRFIESGYRLRALVLAVVESPLFREP